jgi:hypothetical protein
MKHSANPPARCGLGLIASGLVAAGIALVPSFANAQTGTIIGGLGNFDVVNNTGQDACGFVAEIEGLPSCYPVSYFSAQRYGIPVIEDYVSASGQSGRRMTYRSNDCSNNKTVPFTAGGYFGGRCYSWNGLSYPTSGCEHFGVRYWYTGPSTVTYRWLVDDAANPGVGSYVPHDPSIQIATPAYYIQPAPVPAPAPAVIPPPPVIVAVVPAPPPPPARFGEPHWMKTYVRQLPREVTLDELITENPTTVPMDAATLETNWELLQADPPGSGGRRKGKGLSTKGASLAPTTRTVARRYETYAYTGPRDALTNEALCADLTCSAPSADELGDFISANMTAVLVQGDFITVAKDGTGGGLVETTDKRLSCGNKCTSPYTAGTSVTLTAKANSGSVFAGWAGACAGPGNCTVTVNGANNATATFNTVVAGGGGGGGGSGGGGGGTVTPPNGFQLKVSTGNPGVVTSDVGGINCGSACQTTVAANTVVVLTAIPPAGKTFAAWSGACAGTANVCAVTVNANLSVKANFNK